jgi:hypothetical protein
MELPVNCSKWRSASATMSHRKTKSGKTLEKPHQIYKISEQGPPVVESGVNQPALALVLRADLATRLLVAVRLGMAL